MVNPSSSSSSLSTSSSTAASKGAASSVAPHNPPRSLSREEEIELVRSGLRAQPKDSQRWHPIVYEWFLRWKDFVDFDNNNSHSHSHSPQEVTTTVAAGLPPAPGPGPIDNSSLSLSADHPTELRPGLGEGQDIILLPLSTASYLFQKYGGGPMTFSRGVLSLGPHHHQINLYPVRVEAYLCDSVETCYPMKSKEVQGHYLKAYFNKTFTMDKVVEELTQKFSVPVWYKLRYWLRRPGQGPSVAAGGGGGGSATSVLESKASESSQMDTVDDTDSVDDSKKAVVAVAAGGGGGGGGVRYLRKEVVEWDGDWKLFYSEDQAILRQTLAELLEESASGGGGGVEVIVEAAKRTSYSLEGTPWPRDKVLNRWKTLLRVGDVLDVQDKAKKWYEGRVVSTTSEGDLVVHFLAWEKDFDEKLLAHTLYQRCRPLHSETEDRWTWKEGSQVEVCCQPKKVAGGGGAAVAGGGKCHWVAGVVKKVEGERLAVEFTPPKGFTCRSSTSEEVVEQQEEEESVMVTEEEVAVGGGGEEEDDDKRKLRGVIPSTSTTSVESKVVTCWFDRYQEDICAHHVHLPAYRSNTRTPTASSYLSSSYITPSSSSTTSPLTTTTTTGVGRYSSSSYTSSYTSSYSSYSYDSHSRGQPPAPGVVGLANLGNTCFLNSILQCLSHTAVLTNYFLSSSSSYLQEINYNNPLGHNGKLVLAYRQVLADLWSNHYLKVVPRDFKSTLGQFQPQFAGYDQQDAQELLGFLLDGLHEDLNRVTSKPYVSQLESKNRSDEVVARECWRRYLSRNDSFLVDHLFGLLKSHVTCTKCGRQSVTFDAYNVLSLPLPIRQTRKVTILMQLLLAKPFSSSTTSAITTSTSTTRTPSNTTEVEVKWVKMELEPSAVGDNRIESLGIIHRLAFTRAQVATVSKLHRAIRSLLLLPLLHHYNSTTSATSSTSLLPPVTLSTAEKDLSRYYTLRTSTNNYSAVLGPVLEQQEEEEEVAWAGLAALGREVLVITLRGPLQGSTIVRDYLDPEKLARLLPSAMEEQEEEEGESSSSAMEQEEEVGTDDEDKSFSRNTTRPRYDSHGSSVMKKEGKKTLRGGAGGGSGSSKSRGGGLSIYDCLEKFVEREKLASTETLYCPVCKEHLSPIKKMDVYTTPDVLILHLKRFLFVPGQYFVHRDKINDVVDFPITGLDLRKFVIGRGSERGSGSSSVEEQEDDSRYLYDLYAVSHHMGGLGGGHYTATAYNTEAKKWYYFNDSSVSETEPSSAVNGTAYVLFYRRRGAAMKWGGLLPSAEPLPDDPDDEQK
eukprot:gene6999-7742_t